MTKFIIIVSVYDQENTQAYPLGGIFETKKAAVDYWQAHLREVLCNHWTRNREDGVDDYFEEFDNIVGRFEARDGMTGQSLEIDIHELSVCSPYFPVLSVSREDLEYKGFDAANLSDDTMSVIASKASDYMLDELPFWDAIVTSCEWHKIPRKE